MRLAAVSDVRAALRFDSIARNDAAIVRALETATVQLEGDLRRHFAAREVTDQFILFMPEKSGVTWRYRLALTDGFLSAEPVITWGATRQGLIEAPQSFESWQIMTNLKLGEVWIESDTPIDQYVVKVVYDCGLALDVDDAELYDVTDHPWLKDASIAYGIHNLISSNPDMAGGDKGPQRDAKDVKNAVMPTVRTHMRYFANAIRPTISGEIYV